MFANSSPDLESSTVGLYSEKLITLTDGKRPKTNPISITSSLLKPPAALGKLTPGHQLAIIADKSKEMYIV